MKAQRPSNRPAVEPSEATPMPRPRGRPGRYDGLTIEELGWQFGLHMTPEQHFKALIDAKPFAEVLAHASGLSHTNFNVLFSIRYALKSADARMPRRPTRKDTAAMQALVTEMTRLKSDLEEMLRGLEDWAESRVAMAVTDRASHTSMRTSPTLKRTGRA
jgi:hypothetical protein